MLVYRAVTKYYERTVLHLEHVIIVEVHIDVTGGTYTEEVNGIKVTVITNDGAFAEPVKLSVRALSNDSEEYKIAEGELAAINHEYDGMVAFDIHFKSEATELEVEPAKTVDVKIEVTDAEAAGIPEEVLGALTIAHIFDDGGAEVVSEPELNDEPVDMPEFETGNEFETDVFSTYTISWWYSGNHSYDIHYVDTEGNSLTPTITPTFTNDYMFLIYDVKDYEYDSTHYGSQSGTEIKPLLRIDRYDDRQYYSDNGWRDLRDDIYVVYKKKTEPTIGGTPSTSQDETWPEGDDAPQFSKSSVNNGDGTNTISLDIAAAEKPVEKSTPADVIVVFDVSGSMKEEMNRSTRLKLAKDAVNEMAETLLAKSGVRMALISFSTTADTVVGLGDDASTDVNEYKKKVNSLSADGGTNWEQALQLANQMEVRSDAATFIVFVTDGDPTFRVSRGKYSDSDLDMYSDSTYQYYRNNNVFGEGNGDSKEANFNFAVEEVKSIKNKKKDFYAIGISNSVTKVQNLTTKGGYDSDHAFIASDSDAMTEAFDSITNSIRSILGFGDVEINDGITSLSSTEMKGLEEVDPNSFQYYRWGGENNKYGVDYDHKEKWTSREADGCAAASYNKETGTVQWNMGEKFQLEDGVHYVVTFSVWPSQDAYDLIADLNNGIKVYAEGSDNSITEEERAQVVVNDDGTYSLKTNTDNVNATYNKTTKTGDTVTVSDTTDITAQYNKGHIDNMALNVKAFTVKKVWNNDLDSRSATSVDLIVTKEGKTYLNDVKVSANSSPAWTSKTVYISCGYIKKTDAGYTVKEPGRDYTVKEPDDYAYYWDLTADVYHPMMINGTATMLILNDKATGTDGTDYYTINGHKYVVSTKISNDLTATNDRRSNLNLTKKVNVENAPSDDMFEYTVTIGETGEDDIWFSAYDAEGNIVKDLTTSASAEDGNTGYYFNAAGTAFTLEIAKDWNVRFINLPTGTEYSIEETDMPDYYSFASVAAEATDTTADWYTIDSTNTDMITGTIIEPNNSYTVTYTNNLTGSFYVYHSSDNTIEKISVEDSRVTKVTDESTGKSTYTFNIVNETKTGYLYGGYYKSYAQQNANDAQITGKAEEGNLEYTEDKIKETETEYDGTHTGGFWTTDTGASPYTGSKATAWKKANDNAYTETKGTELEPTVNTVYYLKEVPDSYARPYIQIVYDKYHTDENGNKDNPLVSLYTITALDDSNYKGVGFIIDGKSVAVNKLSSTIKITNADNTIIKLTAKNALNGKTSWDKELEVPRGYLTSKEQSDLIQKDTFTMGQYFITLDGVGVNVQGNTFRTVTLGTKCYVPDDNGIGTAPGITTVDSKNSNDSWYE